MKVDVNSIVLDEREAHALIDLHAGYNIPDDIGIELYRCGLCSQKTALESDGSLTRVGWEVTMDGEQWIMAYREEMRRKKTELVWKLVSIIVPTIIGIATLIVTVLKQRL